MGQHNIYLHFLTFNKLTINELGVYFAFYAKLIIRAIFVIELVHDIEVGLICGLK
jgi:hypothetical protein